MARLYLLDLESSENSSLAQAIDAKWPLQFRRSATEAGPAPRAAARTLARLAVRESFADAGTIALIKEASGRPRLRRPDGAEAGFISISHSRHRVVVAVSDHPVGVDIEFADAARLARSGDGLLRALGARIDDMTAVTARNFYSLWTAHEAAIKLGTDLPALIRARPANLHIVDLDLAGGYEMALMIRPI